MQAQIDSLKHSLEAEVRAKAEQARQRKKIEDMKDDLDHQLQVQNEVVCLMFSKMICTSTQSKEFLYVVSLFGGRQVKLTLLFL